MTTPPTSQTNPLDPVFSGVPVVISQGNLVNPTWNKWFVDLREKVNVINNTLGMLSGATVNANGALAISSGGTGQTTAAAAFNALSPLTAAGDILYFNGTENVRLPVGTNGYILQVVSGVPTWQTAPASSPLTTKGDVYTYATGNARLPVGADGYVLTASSGQPTGLTWAPPGTPTLPVTTKGDLLGFNSVAARVPVGPDGYVLTADSTNALGVSWKPVSGGGGGVNSWFGIGIPTTLHADGDVYTNVVPSPMVSYVQQPGSYPFPRVLGSSFVNGASASTTCNIPPGVVVVFAQVEKAATSVSISSVTSPNLTFSNLYTSTSTDASTATTLWVATNTSPLGGEVITATSPVSDDMGLLVLSVLTPVSGPSLFVNSEGFPVENIPLSGSTFSTSCSISSPGTVLVAIVTASSTTGVLGSPDASLYQKIGRYGTTSGSRYLYMDLYRILLSSPSTITGTTGSPAAILGVLMRDTATSSWIPFGTTAATA